MQKTNNIDAYYFGILSVDCPFAELFPDNKVPLRSHHPVTINNQECYQVEGKQLTIRQLKAVSQAIADRDKGFYVIDEVRDYVIDMGYPIPIEYFEYIGECDVIS